MKIVLFISGLGNGGAERVFIKLLKYLSDAGHSVELVSATNKGSLQYDKDLNIKFLNANFGYLSFYKYYKYLKMTRPNVVVATLSSSIFTAAFVNFFFTGNSCKLICRIANVYQKPNSFLKIVDLAVQKFSLATADGIIFNSKATMKSVLSLLSIDLSSKNKQTIGNPVLDDDYQTKKLILQDKYPPPTSQTKTLVFIGRLVPQKRVDHAIKAFSMVVRKTPDSRLIIVGDGPERSQVVGLINKHNISNKVELLDYCNDIPKLLTSAHCLINTSKFEGFGNVFIEGLAYCNNLVSYYSIGGASELLPPTNAVLVPDGDIDGMSRAIIDIFNQERAPVLATKAYLMSFTTSNIGKQYLEFIDSVVTNSNEKDTI